VYNPIDMYLTCWVRPIYKCITCKKGTYLHIQQSNSCFKSRYRICVNVCVFVWESESVRVCVWVWVCVWDRVNKYTWRVTLWYFFTWIGPFWHIEHGKQGPISTCYCCIHTQQYHVVLQRDLSRANKGPITRKNDLLQRKKGTYFHMIVLHAYIHNNNMSYFKGNYHVPKRDLLCEKRDLSREKGTYYNAKKGDQFQHVIVVQ